MNTINDKLALLDVRLPSQFEVLREQIAETVQPYLAITAKADANLRPWQSKFAGVPYMPHGFPFPENEDGRPMYLLAQINFCEMPILQDFPETGILQFYLSSNNDDFYNTQSNRFQVLFFPEVVEDENELLTHIDFFPLESDFFPIADSCSLHFAQKYAPLPQCDYQFFNKILRPHGNLSNEELDAIDELYSNTFPSTGHKLGGYPDFTQNDPRLYQVDKDYRLLFQIDSDRDNGIMWGDVGVGNFFIREGDLQNRNFASAFFYWDCC